MKKVLITGITGYIGSQLAKALISDCTVYGLVRWPLNETYLTPELREHLTLLPCDGSGEGILTALKSSCPDMVYHLAAHYTTAHDVDAISQLLTSNLSFGAYLLEAMYAVRCNRLVYATTVTTHCMGTGYRPLTFYAATKQAFADLVEYYAGIGALNAAAVALSDTYGPGDRRPKVLNLIRRAAEERTSLDLTSGQQIFDAVFIDDVVSGLIHAADALKHAPDAHQFFQLSSLEPRSLRDTVELLLQVSGLDFHADWGRRPDPVGLMEDPSCVYSAPPGWKPKIKLEEGLRLFWSRGQSEQGGT